MKTSRPSFTILSAIFALLAATTQFATAAQVTLAPSKDNSLIQVTSASAAQLSNGLGDIFVGRTNQDGQGPATISMRRGLMAFDVAGSGIPAGATITSVSLTMRDVMGLNGDRAVKLHRTSADWGEGTSFFSGGQGGPATTGDSTWFYSFYDATTPAASTPWATPGGDYAPTASGSSIVSDDLGAGQLFTWSSATNPAMIADIQFWLANPASNFGWTLIGDESAGQTAKRLNSSESTTAPNVPPSLVIEYTAVPEPSTLALATVALIGFRVRRRT
ncbi:DNRLRE domain-containing protein [Lacipirellula sp.]|uniref:PEP-CTERM sorting domain-containing protein n=1 Tax=Lacipirellula sp. TaxID=2691419 RepID=UPI003D0D7F89